MACDSRPSLPSTARDGMWHYYAAALFALGATAPLLAYRYSTPLGNLTPTRLLLGIMVFLALPQLISFRVSPRAQWFLGAQLALFITTFYGFLYTSRLNVGLVQVLNEAEALLIVVCSVLYGRLMVCQGRVDLLRRLPLLAFVPSGLLGLSQAVQLATGATPTIPLIGLTGLNEASANAARTAFGTGRDALGLDRIAAATGDPPTFGILCALVLSYGIWLSGEHRSALRKMDTAILLLASVGLLLSQSVSAILVFAVYLCVHAGSSSGRRLRHAQPQLLRLTLISLVAVLLGMSTTIGRRFLGSVRARFEVFSQGEGTLDEHRRLLSEGSSLFLDHVVQGVGAGAASSLIAQARLDYSSFHNALVLRLAEGGLIGAAALLALWLVLVRRFLPAAIAFPLFAAWLLYLDHNRLPYIWFMIGAIIAQQGLPALLVRPGVELAPPRSRQPSSLPSPGAQAPPPATLGATAGTMVTFTRAAALAKLGRSKGLGG